MKPRLQSTPTIFALVVILAVVIHFPALKCQETRPYDTCGQSIQCGDLDFGYPFWGLDRPDYCGHRGFQLTCQSNVPELVLGASSSGTLVTFRILDIDSSGARSIVIARNDLWDTICPTYLYNTTYDTTILNGNNFEQEDVSLYYGCQQNLSFTLWPGALNYRFDCTVNRSQSDSYFVTTSTITTSIASFLVQCNSSIRVPVSKTWADKLATAAATEDDLRSALKAGFRLGWTVNNEDCDRCVRSGGRCGSNATTPDLFACYCANGNFSVTCNHTNGIEGGGGGGSKGNRRKLIIIIGISCSFAGIMLLLFVILYRKLKSHLTSQGPKAENDQIEIFIRNYESLAPKRYKYSEIRKMTNSFLDKVGQGGYGSVYKGQLPDGQLVAVKLLSEATGNGEDFINEVASIGSTSHVNIVTLLGFCFQGKKRALLYEFMPNGSLDKFLRGDGFHLGWNALFQIAKGIARGLEYLHRGCNTRIVHFDIKPHNILLDEEFVPKISDFGLAKLCKKKQSIVSVIGARGTAGYMAPEVFFRTLGGASHKSDVYSYGMMVLEMTGARKHNNTCSRSTSEAYFPDWIYKQVEVGGDLGDYGVTNEEEEELVRKMMMVSLWCIQSNPSDRPSISKVVEMLEGNFESLQVPPRHFETSPPMTFQGTPHSSTQSSNGERVSTVQGNISLPNSHQGS